MSEEGLKIRGMYRVQIEEDGSIVGDSGWKENQVVNLGFNWYLAGSLGAIVNSSQVSYMALGTGAAPAAADTALAGEVSQRTGVTAATSADSKAVRFTATFASVGSFVLGNSDISNIGLHRSAAAGTLFAGAAYASSTVATNQNVNCTYDVSFS